MFVQSRSQKLINKILNFKALIIIFSVFATSLSELQANEKYVRNVIFEISRQDFNKAQSEDGSNFFNIVTPLPEHEQVAFGVDGNTNVFILFKDVVRVFDKNGNFLKKIPLVNLAFHRGNSILVDEDGSFFIYDRDDPDGNGYVFDVNGVLVKHFLVNDQLDNPNFLSGIIYSANSGKTYYSVSHKALPQKNFLSNFDETNSFQKDINGFQVHYVQAIDLTGAIYAIGSKMFGKSLDEYGKKVITRDYALLKFDSNLNFLTLIDIGPRNPNCYIDVATSNVYDVEISSSSYRFVVWSKNN